jgi:hypothetical protein
MSDKTELKGWVDSKSNKTCMSNRDCCRIMDKRIHRVRGAEKRWRATYRKEGITGLQDTCKGNSWRPSEKELPLAEKYERLQTQNNFPKAENELLKKLEMVEGKIRKKIK